MKNLPFLIIPLLLATPLPAEETPAPKTEEKPAPKAEEAPVIKAEPLGDAVEITTPGYGSIPERKWITRRFRITNISGKDYQVPGYSRGMFLHSVHYKKASGKWMELPSDFCGTGINLQPFPSGSSFIAEATFPIESADVEFIFRFTRVSGTDPNTDRPGETTQTPLLRMK